MRMLVFALALALASPALAAFEPASFVQNRMNLVSEKPLSAADWKKFDAAYGVCARDANATKSEAAFIACLKKNLPASLKVVRK